LIHVLLASTVATFLLLEALRSYPFADDLVTYHPKDDWATYRALAESVLDGGLTIPALPKSYGRPGGFLYVYFVAGVMRVLGRNSTLVYLVQSALLGLCVVVVDRGFARRLSAPARLTYLVVVAGFLYVDFFRHYTNRLLSENLILILLPLALALLVRAQENPSGGRGLVAGVVLGAAILTRPNLLPLGLASAVLLATYPDPRGHPMRTVTALLGGAGSVVGLMVLRNYLVTGELSAAVFTDTTDWMYPRRTGKVGLLEWSWGIVAYYGRRVLFMLGWLPILEPTYRVRPHWLGMWAGVAAFAATTWRRPVAFWEAALMVSLVFYLAPLVAVGHIANYGFRMAVPAVPLALLLAVRGVERWRPPRRQPDGQAANVPVTERP
jgi:hypothetical protein